MSNPLKKIKPRPRKPDCKCCIAKELRESRKLARKGGHTL